MKQAVHHDNMSWIKTLNLMTTKRLLH